MIKQLIKDLKELNPDVDYIEGDSYCWSPESKTITYNKKAVSTDNGKWALLHEVAHASLGHKTYTSDLGLLKLEVDAWDLAKNIGKRFDISIDEDHIQDCLDTYRDWLHRRSTCPNCDIICIQTDQSNYKCHNCHTTWTVTTSKFCRPYRLKLLNNKEKRSQSTITAFS